MDVSEFFDRVNIMRESGKFSEALETIERTLSNCSDNEIKASCYYEMSENHAHLGEFDKSMTDLSEAKKLSQDEVLMGKIHYRYGLTCRQLGDFETALKELNEAEDIFKQYNIRTFLAKAHSQTGQVYIKKKEYKEALRYLEESLAMSLRIKDEILISEAYTCIGDVKNKMSDFKGAVESLKKALEYAKRDYRLSVAYNNLAMAYRGLGGKHFEDSLRFYNLSLKLKEKLDDKVGESETHHELGVLWRDKPEAGEESRSKMKYHFRQSIAVLSKVKQTIDIKKNEDLKVSFTDKYRHRYFDLQLACVLTNDLQLGLETSEALRASSLNELLSEHGDFSSSKNSLYSALKFDDILETLQSEDMSQTSVLGFTVHKKYIITCLIKGEEKSGNCTVSFLLKDTKEWLKSMNLESMESFAFNYRRQRDISQGERKLPHGLRLDANFSEEDVVTVDLSGYCTLSRKRAMENCNRKEINEISSRGKQLELPSIADVQRKLYELFILDVEKKIPKKTQNLIIIPHEYIYSFSFHEFLDYDNNYMFKKFRIRLIPSIHTLKLCKHLSIPKSQCKALIVGNPTSKPIQISYGNNSVIFPSIKYAEKEACEIANMFWSKPLIGKNATKKEFLSRMGDATLIHISAHGIESGELLFAPNSSNACTVDPPEVLLSSDDLKDHKLKADLVVLSCCLSGCGKTSGEGVLNVARRFLACGAKALVVTLWGIPDAETLEFMKIFYTHLKDDDVTASEALRLTMEKMSRKYPNPYFWAAFQLIGTDVKINFQEFLPSSDAVPKPNTTKKDASTNRGALNVTVPLDSNEGVATPHLEATAADPGSLPVVESNSTAECENVIKHATSTVLNNTN